jgi:hypothetical protein
MVVVAARSASASSSVVATITSGLRPTTSRASWGKRSGLPHQCAGL